MKKCWSSQVIALSAFYSVLIQSEQLLKSEAQSIHQHYETHPSEETTDQTESLQELQPNQMTTLDAPALTGFSFDASEYSD